MNRRYNSTIPIRTGPCLDCGIIRPLIADRCQGCYKKHRQRVKEGKPPAKVISINHKTFGLASDLEASIELAKWFKRKMEIVAANPHCMECGAFIPSHLYKHAVAHIFPKAHFQSVQSHEYNYLILGAGCCHDKSHKIETFKKMKVWPIAVYRFRLFEKEITEHHKYLNLFRDAIDTK